MLSVVVNYKFHTCKLERVAIDKYFCSCFTSFFKVPTTVQYLNNTKWYLLATRLATVPITQTTGE